MPGWFFPQCNKLITKVKKNYFQIKNLITGIFTLFCFAVLSSALTAQGIDVNDTRLLSQPAISMNHIAFVYAGDLWIANTDGTHVRRLTSDEGIESNPAFSPDDKRMAYNPTL